MARVAAAQSLTRRELAEIALNGFARAFAPDPALAPVRRAAREAWEAWLGTPIS
jgi:hypothetical protein